MKYTILIVIAFLCLDEAAFAQRLPDSIKATVRRYAASKKNDTARFWLYWNLSIDYRRNNSDSALYYGRLALKLSKQMDFKTGEANSLGAIDYILGETGHLAEALNMQLEALDAARVIKNKPLEAMELNSIGNSYIELGDPKTALGYYRKAQIVIAPLVGQPRSVIGDFPALYWQKNEISNIGNTFEKIGELDSALIYETKSYRDPNFPPDLMPELLERLGTLKVRLGDEKEAMRLFKKGVALSFPVQVVSDRAMLYYKIAALFDKWHQPDSSILYARKSYRTAQTISLSKTMLNAATLLARVYAETKRLDSAFYYQRAEINYNDSLFGVEKFRRIQLILSNEQIRQQKVLQEQRALRIRYLLIGGIIVLLLVLIVIFILSRNNRLQKKQNRLLTLQKTQITTQRDEIKNALDNLHKTQTQLIQSEKMASLGELTAGIAHEIQNPLNFVNNFSEVNQEMLEELKAESKKPKAERDEALETELINDLIENEQKINHHGKRADGIVKGMLEHSRGSAGQKEPTDLNKLADEYLRLSYHGLRAKDKSFNAELTTHFDPNLPKVKVSQQDMGRVMLNLFNNAFYAVNQKAKTAVAGYKPEVSVTTSTQNGQVVITVKDNGVGIPDAIKEKIMQPFFTTKPTGEGTGLGLSLTYDMVVKGHGGSIQVNSIEGEGSEFIIILPVG
jgi:signal transduction histidine kinase